MPPAGRGLLGAVEEADDSEVRAVFATNVFGLLAVTRAVLPVMRAQRSGRILNISSVGGFATSPGWGVYGATKFAVEGLSEALRAETAPLGITVTIVEPGMFRTDFLDATSLHTARQEIDDYADTAGVTRASTAPTNHTESGDPVKGAAAIITITITIASAPEPPLRLQLGADCLARVRTKVDRVAAEMERWRGLALSTGYDNANASR